MKKVLLISILPALLLIWWGLGRADSAPTLHFAQVRSLTIESIVSTNGKVEPAQWAAARAETAGIVRSIATQRGASVSAGQMLVSLDTAAAESDVASALAHEQETRAEAATANQGGRAATVASISDSISAAQTAVDVAQRHFDSMQRMAAQQAATKLQVQEASDALQRAKLQLAAAQNQRKTLVTMSDREVAQAKVHEAAAAVALARRHLSLDEIASPISGTVYSFDLKVGAYLQPGELVALVGDLDRMKVKVYVDEPDLGRVGVGMPVRITWDARPGQQWWGRVDRMPTEVIALGTRTVGEVATIVDNPNRDLIPGVSVNASIVSKVVKDKPAIPKAALHTLNGGSGVYKLTGDTVVWTSVRTGVSDVNNVEIVAGLQPGERVADRVVEPSDAEIRSGMRVRAARR